MCDGATVKGGFYGVHDPLHRLPEREVHRSRSLSGKGARGSPAVERASEIGPIPNATPGKASDRGPGVRLEGVHPDEEAGWRRPFLADGLEDTHIEDGGLDKKAMQAKLEETKGVYGTKHGEQKFHGWHLQASALISGTSIAVAFAGGAFESARGAHGGHAYHPGGPADQSKIPPRGRGRGASSHYGQHRGRGGSGRGKWGGRSPKPVWGACARKGLASDHSHRVCPFTTGDHCPQNGHIKSNCLNP